MLCSGIIERCMMAENQQMCGKMHHGRNRIARGHYSFKVHIVSQNKSNYSENLRGTQELIGGDEKCPQTLANTGVSVLFPRERKN